MRCLPIASAIAVVIAGSAARADGIGAIAAGPAAGDRAATAAAMADAIAAGGGRSRIVSDAVAEARAAQAAGAVTVTTLAQYRRVRELIDEGWRAFLRVQIDFAHSRLAAARSAAEALAALPGGTELYADAALRLGAVMQYRRIPEAQAVLALALALDPDRPITLAEFSPDVVDAVAAVRAAPAAMQRLHVAAQPAGAMISIDGATIGAAPVDAQVARGQHLIIARAPLHRAAVQGVAVDGAASMELALDPDDDAVRLAGGAEAGLAAPAVQALVDAALEFGDLDEVVVAAVSDRPSGTVLTAQRCGGAPARCTVAAEVGMADRTGLPAAAREAWRAVQDGALVTAPRAFGDMEHLRARSRCELCRNPLVWAGVGAVVIGTVIAIVAASGSRPPPVLTVNGGDFGH